MILNGVAGNPFVRSAPHQLYCFGDSPAAQWVTANPGHPRAELIRDKLTRHPAACWVGGGNVAAWVEAHAAGAQAEGALPVYVAYNIVLRDIGQGSSGGEATVEAYLEWAQRFALAVGNRPAVLLVEPDSLIHMSGLRPREQQERLRCLRGILSAFGKHAPQTALYLDAGDGWYNSAVAMVPWLIEAGISQARGFTVNIANFNTTADVGVFARKLVDKLTQMGLRDKGFVVDTSRNGHGRPLDSYIKAHPRDWWCNPPGIRVGHPPSVANDVGADALVWVKHAGVSDGLCGKAAHVESGVFDPELAVRLLEGR